MSTHIVTQIKRQVDQARCRQYSLNKDKKQLKFYGLYIKQIVKIQRMFRSYMARKTRVLEQCLIQQLTLKESLHFREINVTQQLSQLKQKSKQVHHISLNKLILFQKQNLKQNTKTMLANLVDSADRYAKNTAACKLLITELSKYKKQQKQLQAQVKQLQLQRQCVQQRISGWQNKLREIRNRVMEEMASKKSIQVSISQYSNQ